MELTGLNDNDMALISAGLIALARMTTDENDAEQATDLAGRVIGQYTEQADL